MCVELYFIFSNMLANMFDFPFDDRQLFSGEPLFSHIELIKGKKLHVFPAIHSPNLMYGILSLSHTFISCK